MAVKSREESLEEARHALREAERKLEELGARLAETKSEEQLASLEAVAARFKIPADALRAFAETAGELLGGEPLSEADARRAAMVAVSRVAWERELGPLLSGAQARELLGGVSRQRVDELVRGRRVISLQERSGRRRYPLFQFEDGHPLEPIVTAFWIVAGGAASDWTAASWCVRTDPALGNRSPVDWVRAGRDPERVLQIARQDAARLTR